MGIWHHGTTGSQIWWQFPERYYRWTSVVLPLERYYRWSTVVLPCCLNLTVCQHCTFVHFFQSLCISCVLLFPRSWCWSGDGSRRTNPKRKATGGSGASTPLFKKMATKKKAVKPVSELSLREYQAYRKANPYRLAQDPDLVGSKFWNKTQQDVFNDVLKERKNLYVPNVKIVSLEYMRIDMAYFGVALDLCDQFGISDIISFNKDFDAELVAQFFATVYFSSRDDQTMIWMCHDQRVSCS